MKKKMSNILTLLAYGALLASVVLGIVMLVNFYRWYNYSIVQPESELIITESIEKMIQQRQDYLSTALSMIQPVCYTLFSGFALLVAGLILKLEPKQIWVK